MSATPHVFMRHSLMLPSQVLLVLTLAYGHGILAEICKRPIMVRLSKSSFTMYLLHLPLLTVFVPLFKGYGELPIWGFFSFILLLLACSLSWKIISLNLFVGLLCHDSVMVEVLQRKIRLL